MRACLACNVADGRRTVIFRTQRGMERNANTCFQPGEEVGRGAQSMIDNGPEFTTLDCYPITDNDATATAKLAQAFDAQFGDRPYETGPASASEDFSIFGRVWKVPYVFRFVGGTDPKPFLKAKKAAKLNAIPNNHSPKFAPTIHATVKTGLQAMLTAAAAWLD